MTNSAEIFALPPSELSIQDANTRDRCLQLAEIFGKEWGMDPTFFVRAPGRVNLIGEHIDYMGFSVLPMAIDQDVIIAVASTAGNLGSPRTSVINLDSSFPKAEFPTGETKAASEWHNYVACGIRGASEDVPAISNRSLRLAIHGTIPAAAGLSSSSALVCASALAAYKAEELAIGGSKVPSKLHLSSICCVAERHIGTMGGGMDQAASFLSLEGAALHISFCPSLSAEPVLLPAGGTFIVANSLAAARKAEEGNPFNVRVAECRIACLLLAKALSLACRDTLTLFNMQSESGLSLEEFSRMVESNLPDESLTMEKVALKLGVTVPALLDQIKAPPMAQETHVHPGKRARHVISEAVRVQRFLHLCRQASTAPDAAAGGGGAGGRAEYEGGEVLKELGALMDASHASCRDDYDCRAAGALGARLTGAGWGGCVVALVPSSRAGVVTSLPVFDHCFVGKKWAEDSRSL